MFAFDKYSDLCSKIKDLGDYFTLGPGTYEFELLNDKIALHISNYVDEKEMLHCYNVMNNDIVKQIIVTCSSAEVFNQLIKDSFDYVSKLKQQFISSVGSLKKYIYDAKDMYWNESHSTHYRDTKSLFLREGDKERLLAYIDDFVDIDTKNDYIKFNIPYKSNVLLYGKPGTGKTSTILTIASHMKTNIGLIPISNSLDDAGLINALSGVKKNKCKIVVIEDIDCLFCDRKKHDSERNSLTLSGLLNCMDGLFRADGIIVFLTTNKIEELDEALVRSARIDFKLEYSHANEYQIKQCFDYYFPSQKDSFERFYDKIAAKQYTIADLQCFFFKHRKCDNILQHIKELNEINKDKELANSLYM